MAKGTGQGTGRTEEVVVDGRAGEGETIKQVFVYI